MKKRVVCSAAAIIMLLGIMLYIPVSATVTVLDSVGVYASKVNSTFGFRAPETGVYAIDSYDNSDPFLRVEYADGTIDKFDNEKEDGEFCAFVTLSEGEEVRCKAGTRGDDKKIKMVISKVAKPKSDKDYTVKRNYFYFKANHDDYYQIYSFSSADPYFELYRSGATTAELFDDEVGAQFFSEIYLKKGESFFGFVSDYEGGMVNFRISCDCSENTKNKFEVGNTYKAVPDGTEFTFTAPYEGTFVFKSAGSNDPCFSYIRQNMFTFEYDDENYSKKKLDFNVPVYLLKGEKINCRLSDRNGKNINFSVSYDGKCKHTSKQWVDYKGATRHEKGIKLKTCKACSYIFEHKSVSQLKPETPKTSAMNYRGGVAVSWNKVDGAVKYVVYRKKVGSDKWINIRTTTSGGCVDTEVKNNTSYYYAVKAVNSSGIYSDYISSEIYKIKYVATPKLKKIQNTTSGVCLEWSGIPSAKEYRVYRKAGNCEYWTCIAATNSLKYIDTATKNKSGTSYKYTVSAVNGDCSSFDAEGLTEKRLVNPVMKSAVSSGTGITVKWGAVKGAVKYNVYRKSGKSGWVKLGVVNGADKVSFVDKTAKKGVTYTYTARAVNGKSISSYSSTISCKDKY